MRGPNPLRAAVVTASAAGVLLAWGRQVEKLASRNRRGQIFATLSTTQGKVDSAQYPVLPHPGPPGSSAQARRLCDIRHLRLKRFVLGVGGAVQRS